MAVVIRLQGLNVTAGSADIRRFFTGLRIPDGGVHIIGGELDEAFIIFASDEDARRAMTRSGGFINGAPVSLLLSSKQEMQSVLERTTQNVELDDTGRPEGNGRPARGSMDLELGRRSSSRSGYSPPLQHQRPASNDDPFVVFLNGLPFSVTETQIIEFFNGLVIDEIVLCKKLATGQNNGKGFVRFASKEDTLEALKRDRKYIGSRYVDVRSTTADCWLRAGGSMPGPVHTLENFERGRAPVRSQRYPDYQDRSRSPVVQGPTASKDEEYCVLLDNLSYAVEKEDVKHIFPGANLENDQILFLANEGRRTRSAFVLFKSMRDYSDALSQEKRLFRNRLIHVRAISRENMLRLLESSSDSAGLSGNSERFQGSPPSDPRDRYDSERVYAVVRNLPFDVRKVEIIDFFHGFNITEDKVRVLRDHKGDGIGQALVLFGSEAEATEALSLNGRRFLGSEVGVKCITHAQMEQLTAEEPAVEDVLPKVGLSSARSSETFYGPGADIRKPKDGNFPIKEERIHGGHDYEPRGVKPYSPRERGSGGHGRFGALDQRYDGPTCVQLVNLPFQIRSEEVYDFCYGYRVIPGSVSLQYEPNGRSKGSATLVFESRQEALNAIQELNGRPIGPRKIQLLLI